ncbi:ComEC/Rec2 family competence protein [Psychrobacter sp. T6-6]|uniref:ComEC/Rec2 family competence protein n=1 Tax=Psychrobacter sp. T6-6 TaxID=3457452 RepID=UPI003FD00A99
MATTIRLLEASHGDSILVSHSSEVSTFNLLIDGGPAKAFGVGPGRRRPGPLRIALDEIKEKGQCVDLVILTHIDSDHIKGLIEAFKTEGYLSDLTKRVWLNASRNISDYLNEAEISENAIPFSTWDTPETSVSEGKTFEQILDDLDCWRREVIVAEEVIIEGPFKFTILSPTDKHLRRLHYIWPAEPFSPYTAGEKNDYDQSVSDLLKNDAFAKDISRTNGSSIAFILEVEQKKFLFLGDSHACTIVETLEKLGYTKENKLAVDYVKLSHHGSHCNTSVEMLDLIECRSYLISTDGTKHGHPHKRTLARILNAHSDNIIYFNYEHALKGILLASEVAIYGSRLRYLNREIQI